MKINKTEFFNKLDKINLLDYKIDYKRNQNYFIYKGFKYVLETIINNDIKENYYKFKI
jgi:hypothetical protein|tara:strand:+ start:600 stop:773 length:174 start_codon:yes stop_codon:yes gene_type:complete